MTSFELDSVCKEDPVSKGHVLRSWRLELQQIMWGAPFSPSPQEPLVAESWSRWTS